MKITFLKNILICVIAFTILACGSGCSSLSTRPVHLLSSSVEIYNANEKEYHISNSVEMGQLAKMNASFTWDSVGGAGVHTFYWELYKGEQCIQKDKAQDSDFVHSPWQIALKIDTTSLGEGSFQGVLYLDGVNVVTVPLTVNQKK